MEKIMNSIAAGDWFVVEPYVMDFSNDKYYLFYNTLSGECIEGECESSYKRISKRLEEHKYSFQIIQSDLEFTHQNVDLVLENLNLLLIVRHMKRKYQVEMQ